MPATTTGITLVSNLVRTLIVKKHIITHAQITTYGPWSLSVTFPYGGERSYIVGWGPLEDVGADMADVLPEESRRQGAARSLLNSRSSLRDKRGLEGEGHLQVPSRLWHHFGPEVGT